MQKTFFLLILVIFVSVLGCSGEKDTSKTSGSNESSDSKDIMANLPEGPLVLPEGSDPEANTHNGEGILHYKEGHFDVALGHFREAEKIKSGIGEIHFNVALALDKLGDHGDAAEHFKVAQDNANGNALILESKVLLAHTQ